MYYTHNLYHVPSGTIIKGEVVYEDEDGSIGNTRLVEIREMVQACCKQKRHYFCDTNGGIKSVPYRILKDCVLDAFFCDKNGEPLPLETFFGE